MHAVPPNVLLQIGAAMAEGERKYGLFSFRETPIAVSDYYDSTLRHLLAWYGGADIDPDSRLPHPIKIIAGMIVIADAMAHGTLVDDRWKPSLHGPARPLGGRWGRWLRWRTWLWR
jgi:hypothetical protein